MATALDYLKECPVCQEDFTDPKVLPCDHSFCQDCLDQIKKGNSIKCPVCNVVHNVTTVKRNFRLMQFLDALNEEIQAKTTQNQGIVQHNSIFHNNVFSSTHLNHRTLNNHQLIGGCFIFWHMVLQKYVEQFPNLFDFYHF